MSDDGSGLNSYFKLSQEIKELKRDVISLKNDFLNNDFLLNRCASTFFYLADCYEKNEVPSTDRIYEIVKGWSKFAGNNLIASYKG